ncbi:MAG TPA: FAD binding domain-containing protein [Spirochaetales bacterium]|mgnify:CR=1 FL=1|nr:FAD binding domain-containing protein [Spirochaetales bacterium]
MLYRTREPQIYLPSSLSELLAQKQRNPEAVPFAGGTYLLWTQSKDSLHLPPAVLFLRNVKEICRIGRTESRLDLGAAASIKRILRAGPKILSPILVHTLELICPAGVSGLATLGGNLSVPDRCMTSFPILHVLDARCEIRNSKRTRWIPVTSLRTPEGNLVLEPTEIITRIQIPLEEWSFSVVKRIGAFSYGISKDSLVLVVLGKTHRSIFSEFRFALGNFSSTLYRNRDLETLLIGSSLPLSQRDIETFLKAVKEDILSREFRISPARLEQTLYLLNNILTSPLSFRS